MEEETISFEDLGLDETTLAAVARKGFVTPSPVQVLAIPRLINGEANVIARARTGTGKTAAFGLPLVQKLREESNCVKAVILEPTRELAMQTCTEMASFTTGRFPRTAVVYGGASIGMQIKDIKRGAEIVVGTPGRVQDLIDRGVLDLSKIEYFILDEGDEMLDMGFIEDIEKIFSSANPDSRILLFSATVPAPILKIASDFMGDYEIVEEEEQETEPLLIEQKYWVIRESEKIEALIRLIDISPDFYGLVFVQKKTDADMVSKMLDEKGYEVAALHGDIPQSQREKILARFRSKKTRVLVATDVAARGIDIEGLTHVVNYSLPFDGPTYVHRIGRTGRAGAAGMAVTFVCPNERRRLGYMKNAIKKSAKGEMVEGAVPSVREVLDAKQSRLFNEIKKSLFIEKTVSENSENAENLENTSDAVKAQVNSSETENPVNKSSENTKSDIYMEETESSAESVNQETSEAAENSKAPENASDTNESDSEEADSVNESGEIEKNLSETRIKLIDAGEQFKLLAKELCEGQEAEAVVASLLSLTYGKALDKKRYGRLQQYGSSEKGRGAVTVKDNQIRLYVQMGWHDGHNPKSIAMFFSKLLHIPNRLIDKIDMADKFCLLTLPIDAGKKALMLSEKDRNLPHMHQDIRSGGMPLSEGFKEASGNSSEKREYSRNSSRDSRKRDSGKVSVEVKERNRKSFTDKKDRYAVAKASDDRKYSRDRKRGEKSSSKGGLHARKSVHTPTERNGSAGLYKKKSGGAVEY